MKEVPLFILNGFLESGKSTLIKEIIENNENYQNNTTVLVVCEEGEVEFDDAWQEKYQVKVVVVEDQDELTPEFMRSLDAEYKPTQFVIEYNSFWDFDAQEFPEYMVIYQQITLIDASRFQVMFNNMKKIFNTMVKYSSLVIFNRCDGINNLSEFRRQIRAFNQQAQIAFEAKDGRLTAMLDEDLPYDLKKDVISIEEDIYPTWYMDVFDNYEKYFNKTFKFKVFVRDITDQGTIVVGRKVMTCCSEDIQFLGYEAINETKTKVKLNSCIYLECEVIRNYSKLAGEEVVMLVAKNISILPSQEENVIGM